MNGNAKSAAAKQLRADEALTPPPTATHSHSPRPAGAQSKGKRRRREEGAPKPDLKSVQGEATCKRKRKILCYSFGLSTLLAKASSDSTRLVYSAATSLSSPSFSFRSPALCLLTRPIGSCFHLLSAKLSPLLDSCRLRRIPGRGSTTFFQLLSQSALCFNYAKMSNEI